MMGYIKSSRYKSANGNAKTVYTAAATYITEYAENPQLADGTAKTAPGTVTDGTVAAWDNATCDTIQDAVNKYLGSDAVNSHYSISADQTSVYGALWSKDGSTYIGSYPKANDPDSPAHTAMADVATYYPVSASGT